MIRRTREQERARHAYDCVGNVPESERDDYKAIVNGFGAFVLKNGLAAALAFVERTKSKKAKELFFNHLASAHIPGVTAKDGKDLFANVRELDVAPYMLATRELLAIAAWLRRAVQASFPDAKGTSGARQDS